jgi:xyloglucan-specific exo-beta-1,4-glucanase
MFKRLPGTLPLFLAALVCNAAPSFAAPANDVYRATAPVKKLTSQAYQWGNAVMGGVEYATGVVINPKHSELLYTRADTGGFFQLDRRNKRWRPMMDTIPWKWSQLYSAESLAIDANNPNIFYADTGGGRWGSLWDVLKTTDGGKTWTRTHLTRPDGKMVYSDTGGDDKPAGERIVCDPNDSQSIWFGTRSDGLFHSRDGAKTWHPVMSFPTKGSVRNGLTFVTLDWKAGKFGEPTQTIYVGVHSGKISDAPDAPEADGGIYASHDGGETWALLTGGPSSKASPQKAKIAVDGTLYVACADDGGFWKRKNGQWINITPPGFAGHFFSGCGLHPTDPNQVLTITLDDRIIFYTKDGGANWTQYHYELGKPTKSTTALGFEPAWETYGGSFQWPVGYSSEVVFDPLNPTIGYETDFSGVNQLVGLGKPTITASLISEGREQITTGDAISPSAGAPLVSGVWDVGGFRHVALEKIPDRIIPLMTRDGHGNWGEKQFEDVFQLDANPAHPDNLVAAGGWQWNSTGDAAYSDDNGRTLREFPTKPFNSAKFGRIAQGVNPSNIVWAPMGDAFTPIYFTQDNGKTWAAGKGCPLGTVASDGPWSFYKSLSADRVRPGWFYLYDRRDGRFYRSEDGGASWHHTATLPTQQGVHYDTHQVRTNPRTGSDVWVSISGSTATGDHGLFHSINGGNTWTRLTGVEWANSVSFGQGKPGGKYPALYLFGQVGGSRPAGEQDADVQLYRSDDLGLSWIHINDASHQFAGAGTITGDNQVWGRVYVATGGRGFFVGTPLK